MSYKEFADQWCEDWNSHDLDRVLSHFSEDIIFTSPLAALVVPGSSGRIEGKAALKAYWEEGLRRIPDLHFTVEHVFRGINIAVIQYKNQKGVSVSEVLNFRDGKVVIGHGTYKSEGDNPAGLKD